MPSISQLFIILTKKCNLSCKHCCFECGPDQTHELQKLAVLNAIHQADLHNFNMIDFSGGEPTLFDTFPEILKYTLSKNFKLVSIASNLKNITSLISVISSLSNKDKKRLFFRIGLDGNDTISHDWLRGKGAFNELMKGLVIFKNYGIEIKSVNTLLHLKNYEHLDKIVKFAHEIGAIKHNWLSIFPFGRGKYFSKYQIPYNIWLTDLYSKGLEYSRHYNLKFTFCGPFLPENHQFTENINLNQFKLKECASNGLIIDAEDNVFAGCLVNMFKFPKPIGSSNDNFADLIKKAEDYFKGIDCNQCNMRFACKGVQINNTIKMGRE